MAEVIWGLLAGFAVSAILGVWLRGHRDRMEKLRHHRARFFAVAQTLLAKDDISDDRLSRLRLMLEDMDTRRAFHDLLSAAKAAEREYRARPLATKEHSAAVSDWAAVVYHYFLAVSYSRAVLGGYLRSILAGVLDPKSGAIEADDIELRLHPRTGVRRRGEHAHA